MISRRSFISGTAAIGAAAAAGMIAGCGGGASSSAASAAESASAESASAQAGASASAASGKQMSKPVIVFFSRAGENYEVGVVDEGNTATVARNIAGKVVADVFELVPAEEYPFSYDECIAQAKQEQSSRARPELADPFAAFDDYDTVYLGYPIWHSDLPMILYTFLESKDWNGKRIVPFCTHGDSGLCATDDTIKRVCKGADVAEALAIRGSDAQEMSMETDAAINAWLSKVRA